MPLLKSNEFIEDTWHRLDEDEAIPETGDILVPLARLLADFGKLSRRQGRLGVEFPNEERPELLEAFLPSLSLIALTFPQFADGRAYSQARQLRQLGFDGELRATGNVLPDQLSFMLEVGFDAFEVTERFSEDAWEHAVSSISLTYQPTYQPRRLHVWRLRWARDEDIKSC